MRFLLVLALFFAQNSYAGAFIKDMSQEELKNALAGKERCLLAPRNDVAKDLKIKVSMIEAATTAGDSVYFAEIENNESTTIVYLKKTHLTLGGFKLQADTGFMEPSVNGSVNFLSKSGTDALIEVKQNMLASVATYYEFCFRK